MQRFVLFDKHLKQMVARYVGRCDTYLGTCIDWCNRGLTRLIFAYGIDKKTINDCYSAACKKKYIQIAKRIVHKINYCYSNLVECTCQSKNVGLFKVFEKKFFLHNDDKHVIQIACECGDYKLFRYVLAKYESSINTYDKNVLLSSAAYGGNVKIFKKMLCLLYDDCQIINSNRVWLNVLLSGNLQLLKYASRRITFGDNMNYLFYACRKGGVKFIKWVIKHCMQGRYTTDNLNDGLYMCAEKNNVKVFDLLVELGASDFESAFESAVAANCLGIIKKIIKHNDKICFTEENLFYSAEHSDEKIIRYLLDNGKYLSDGLRKAFYRAAAYKRDPAIIDLLKSHLAKCKS